MLITTVLIVLLLLWVIWAIQYGPVRGSAALLARGLWISPIFFAFFPENRTDPLPKSMVLRPVRVLVDDSVSMSGTDDSSGEDRKSEQNAFLAGLQAECARIGCSPKISLLSSQDPDVALGYSPIERVLKSWLFKTASDPWLLLSDGGDLQPAKSWSANLQGLGEPAPGQQVPRGFIVGFGSEGGNNIWIDAVDASSFSFEGKPIPSTVRLGRSGDINKEERVQIQAKIQDDAVATVNIEFAAGQKEAVVDLVLPALRRGQYLVTVNALPTASESVLWDNEAHFNVEVMPNTVGILHLLGSPSWDGRFLRRYLKSEPKYDLISFFILRDPWDSQQVNERELSLIPFPVERLFTEELANFRVIVLQNFTMLQFLQPEYQENLVKFVKDGGGLLFMGGARALLDIDLKNSPLKEILPFAVGEADGALSDASALMQFAGGPDIGEVNKNGPWYDEKVKFQIELAKPEMDKRNLANVYDDWEAVGQALESMKWMQGLHHMENVKFHDKDITPLLNARTEEGKNIPFAIASYPGKGRALWFFSDSLWRVAQTWNRDVPRETYGKIMQAAITWLLRQDLKRPLVVSNLEFDLKRDQEPAWRVKIEGPAARFYKVGDAWKVIVCGQLVKNEELRGERMGSDTWVLSGTISRTLQHLSRCDIEVQGTDPAFGSVKATSSAVLPKTFMDKDIGSSFNKLRALADLTGAELSDPSKDQQVQAQNWLNQVMGGEGVRLPDKFRTNREFFWVLDAWYFWLLLLFFPIEVVIRRWEKLVASGGRAYKRAWMKRSS